MVWEFSFCSFELHEILRSNALAFHFLQPDEVLRITDPAAQVQQGSAFSRNSHSAREYGVLFQARLPSGGELERRLASETLGYSSAHGVQNLMIDTWVEIRPELSWNASSLKQP